MKRNAQFVFDWLVANVKFYGPTTLVLSEHKSQKEGFGFGKGRATATFYAYGKTDGVNLAFECFYPIHYADVVRALIEIEEHTGVKTAVSEDMILKAVGAKTPRETLFEAT